MATSYSIIYDVALSKMREYSFLDMDDYEIYEALSPFLKSAEADFARICIEPLDEVEIDRYGVTQGYVADLSNESIEILALGVVCHWSTAYVADADKLRNALGTKDYSVFSPANLLNAVRNLRDTFLLEYHDRINRYSFLYGDLIREQVSRNQIHSHHNPRHECADHSHNNDAEDKRKDKDHKDHKTRRNNNWRPGHARNEHKHVGR